MTLVPGGEWSSLLWSDKELEPLLLKDHQEQSPPIIIKDAWLKEFTHEAEQAEALPLSILDIKAADNIEP